MLPSPCTRDRILQRRAVAMRFEQRRAERGDRPSDFRGARIVQLLRFATGATDDDALDRGPEAMA